MGNSSSDAHFDHAVKLSIEGLKSLFLLNGGAATALIALTDRASGAPNYSAPTVLFGVASFLAVLTFVVGYFSQLSYANHRLSIESGECQAADQALRRHGLCQFIGIFLVVLSLIASGIAMFLAFEHASMARIQHELPTCTAAKLATEPTASIP